MNGCQIWRVIFGILLIVSACSVSFGAIAFDAATDLGDATGTSLMHAVTVTGSNTLGLVTCLGDNIGGGDNLTADWGGAMTLVAKITMDIANVRYQYLWRKVAAATGTVTITAGSSHFIGCLALSYTGVDQTNPIDTFTTHQSSSSAAMTLTTNLNTTGGYYGQTTTRGALSIAGISHISVALKPASGSTYWMVTSEQGYDTTAPGGSTRRVYGASFANIAFFDSNGAAATCSGSSPSWTALTWAGIQTCHDAASSGDTITVTAGSYNVSAQTAITKYVKIVAGGTVTLTDDTCFGTDTSGSGSVVEITESTSGSIRLEGFDFVPGTCFYHGSGSGVIRFFYASGGKPVLLHSNTYTTPYASGDFIQAYSNRGVIWGNTETGGYYYGASHTSCTSNVSFIRQRPSTLDSTWPTAANFGNADTGGDQALYVEDNTLNGIPEGIDQVQAARTVIRYNTFINSAFISHDGTGPSTRFAEIYNNTFIHDTALRADCDGDKPAIISSFIGIRSGTSLIIGNVIPAITGYWGTQTPIGLQMQALQRNHGPYGCWTGSYPMPYNIGWGWTSGGTVVSGVAMDLQPIYSAANSGGGNYDNISVQDYDSTGDPLACMPAGPAMSGFTQANRDFYNQTGTIQTNPTTPFGGTTGTGFGTRANRPSSTTNGVAYWATDAGGNWDTTHGGANDGCLDKVVSGAWVNCWYTPSSYPHPLTITSSSSGIIPRIINIFRRRRE